MYVPAAVRPAHAGALARAAAVAVATIASGHAAAAQPPPAGGARRPDFAAYNASRTPAEWDSIGRATDAAARARDAARRAAPPAPAHPGAAAAPNAPPVVSFRLRNRRPWPTTVEVAGNVLRVGPFGTRYVQFPPGTAVHAYDARRPGGRGARLFAVASADSGRTFGLPR